MNLNMIQKASKHTVEFLVRNSPVILTGLGAAGLVTSVVMGIRATPKAIGIIEAEKEKRYKASIDKETGFQEPLSKTDVVKLVWKCYIPTAAMSTATFLCIIGAHSIHSSRYAALAGLYSLTETALKEYQDKVVEVIGKNKEDKIHESIAQDKLNANPVNETQVIMTGSGNDLCWDAYSGRYFYSDMETIRKRQNDFNEALLVEEYRELNDFYEMLNLEPISSGRGVGWRDERGMMSIRFDSKVATNGKTALVIVHTTPPRPLF